MEITRDKALPGELFIVTDGNKNYDVGCDALRAATNVFQMEKPCKRTQPTTLVAKLEILLNDDVLYGVDRADSGGDTLVVVLQATFWGAFSGIASWYTLMRQTFNTKACWAVVMVYRKS